MNDKEEEEVIVVMSARPPTTYLGTRSHFVRHKRSASIKSYTQLLTTAIRRKFGVADNNNSTITKMASPTKTSATPPSGLKAARAKKCTRIKRTGSGQNKPKGGASISKSQGLAASRSGNASDTSDYQRSTPSPESQSAPGTMDPWPSKIGSQQHVLGDEGFSEAKDHQEQPCSPPSTETSAARCSDHPAAGLALLASSDDLSSEPASSSSLCRRSAASVATASTNQSVFHQQLRIALEKLPITSTADCTAAFRSASSAGKPVKKPVVSPEPLTKHLDDRKLKITHYLSESKVQLNTILRKQKLDKILNLIKTESAAPDGCLGESSSESLIKREVDAEMLKDEVCCASRQSVSSSCSSTFMAACPTPTDEFCSSSCSPTPLRFPLSKSDPCSSSSSESAAELVACKWQACPTPILDSSSQLLDHLKNVHAVCSGAKSEGGETVAYKCLWQGCKVFGKGSSSKSWLEKHVTTHVGTKPFVCIVQACHQRFGTQALLERHVNNHFKSQSGQAHANQASHAHWSSSGSSHALCPLNSASNESSHLKSIRKMVVASGRKIKYRRTIYSARIFDLFDTGVMCQVKQKLSQLEMRCRQLRSLGLLEGHLDQVVVFHGRVLAKKRDAHGHVRLLQRWVPENILEDEWSLEKDVCPVKRVRFNALPLHSRKLLVSQWFEEPPSGQAKRSRKTKRPFTAEMTGAASSW